MMRFSSIDYVATSGHSWLHRTSPLAKWCIVAGAVAAAVVARTPWPLAGCYVALIAAAATCRLPVRTVLVASLLPVPLVGLFALSRWNGDFAVPLAIVAKGMETATAGLLVAYTTPYPQLLAPATRVLPRVVGDSLVLTYRALFILWARIEALLIALRARGGFYSRPAAGALPWPARGTSLARRVQVGASGAALAVLRSMDLSGRMYDVMRLRGYQGRLAPDLSLRFHAGDVRAVVLAGALPAACLVARWTGA